MHLNHKNLFTVNTSELIHHTIAEVPNQVNSVSSTTPNFDTLTYWDSGLATTTFGYYDPKDKEQSLKNIVDVVLERMMKSTRGLVTKHFERLET